MKLEKYGAFIRDWEARQVFSHVLFSFRRVNSYPWETIFLSKPGTCLGVNKWHLFNTSISISDECSHLLVNIQAIHHFANVIDVQSNLLTGIANDAIINYGLLLIITASSIGGLGQNIYWYINYCLGFCLSLQGLILPFYPRLYMTSQ